MFTTAEHLTACIATMPANARGLARPTTKWTVFHGRPREASRRT